jgi:hypothetical protein
MKKIIILYIFTGIVWVTAISLILYWFSWKLLVVLIVFGFAMNLERALPKKNV